MSRSNPPFIEWGENVIIVMLVGEGLAPGTNNPNIAVGNTAIYFQLIVYSGRSS